MTTSLFVCSHFIGTEHFLSLYSHVKILKTVSLSISQKIEAFHSIFSMSKKKPHLPSLFHCSQISHALVQFQKRASEKMKKLRWHNRNKDRLSDLPDCVLLHILSFLNAKQVVQTCLLSKRWNHLWKHLSTLKLRSSHFKMYSSLHIEFVNRILSLRDASTTLNALDFEHAGDVDPHLLERIVSYAVSHNVNHVRISSRLSQIPPSLFSCPSLTSLHIDIQSPHYMIFPNSLNLPALTYLKLCWVAFDTGNDRPVKPFSSFTKLNTLILRVCLVIGSQTLSISNTTLLNLFIHLMNYDYGGYWKVELSAPNLCTFNFVGTLFHQFYGSSFSSIKQMSILENHINLHMETRGLLNWLIEMSDIKSLTVTPFMLQVLSLVPDKLQLKLPSLCNLKSLKLNLSTYSYRIFAKTLRDIKLELAGGKSWKETVKLRETLKAKLKPLYSSIHDGVIDLLLQNSPSAKIDIMI